MTHSIIHRLLHEPRWTKGFLFALTMVLYVNSFNHSFNLDDQLVTDGHRLTSKGLSAIVEIIRSPYYQDDLGYSYDYRPVTHISFAIQHQLFGPGARAGHMVNVLLYALSVLLVFSLSRGLLSGRSPWGPLAVATLFAVHPMHTEVVSSLKNRDEMLSLLFSLLALQRLLARPVGIVNLLSSAPFMLLALLSKLSVAPLLLLAPMLGGIVGLDRRLVISTGALVALVFVPVLVIRDWPLWWVAAIAAVMLAMHGLSHVARNPEALISFFKKWLSFSLPRAPLSWNPVADAKSALAHLLMALPFGGFLISEDPSYLIVCFVLSLLVMFWTGRESGWLLVLSLFAAAIYHTITLYHSLFLVLAVYVTVLEVRPRPHFIMVVFTAVVHLVCSFINVGSDIGLLSVLYYIPVFGVHSEFLKRSMVPTLALLSVAVLIAVISSPDLDTILILVSFSVLYVVHRTRSNAGEFPFSIKVSAMLVAVAVASSTLLLTPPLQGEDRAGRSSSEEVQTLSKEVREVVTAIEDRPLTLVEFPLGAYSGQDVHIGTASAILGHYLKMMFVPWPQAFYYGFDEVPLVRMSDPRAIASAVVHSLLLLIALVLMRAHQVVSFGIIAYVASIALFSNLVSPVAGMIGDRLTYVASFGFCLAAGAGLGLLMERLPSTGSRRILGGAIGAVLLIFGGITIVRSSLWKDPLTLMSHDIKYVPNSSQANYLLGYNLMQASFNEKNERRSREMRLDAITHLKKAASIFPDYLNYWHDLGKAYRDIGDLRSALPCFKEVHRLDSTFFEATFHVGMIAEELGMEDMAIDYYQRCIRINPGTLTAYNNLAFLHFRKGRLEESIVVNRKAIAQNPRWGDPYENIARAYHQLQMPDSVQYYMQRKAELN